MENNTNLIENKISEFNMDWSNLWLEWKEFTKSQPSRHEMFEWWKDKIKKN